MFLGGSEDSQPQNIIFRPLNKGILINKPRILSKIGQFSHVNINPRLFSNAQNKNFKFIEK